MPYTPYQMTPQTTFSTQPVYPGANVNLGGEGGFSWSDLFGSILGFAKDNWKDIARTGADAAGAYLDYDAKQQALKQQREQFEKQYGLASNSQQMQAQNQLNRAPVLDKATYLATNYTPPMPFQPRDYTQGVDRIQGQATGGAAAQLAANNATAANYKAGMGGINTDTLKMILARLQGGQMPSTTGALPPGVIANGPGTGSEQLTLGTAHNNPDGTPVGPYSTQTPGVDPANPYGFSLPERPTLAQVYEAWNRVHPGQRPPSPGSSDLVNFWQEYRRSVMGGG